MPHESIPDPSAAPDPLSDWYRDTIWGRRLDDDDALFEVMSLQVFQAGLTWKMVLDKRDGFRDAFAGWKIDRVAALGPLEVEGLREHPGIIRNRLKIEAVVENARRVQGIAARPRRLLPVVLRGAARLGLSFATERVAGPLQVHGAGNLPYVAHGRGPHHP